MTVSNQLGGSLASFVAGGTISQYRVVVLDSTANQVVAGSAIAGNALGVSVESATANGLVAIQQLGVAKCTASAAISLGDQVMVTASGSGKISTASGATAKSIGIALAAAGADGDIIPVQLSLPTVNGPANS